MDLSCLQPRTSHLHRTEGAVPPTSSGAKAERSSDLQRAGGAPPMLFWSTAGALLVLSRQKVYDSCISGSGKFTEAIRKIRRKKEKALLEASESKSFLAFLAAPGRPHNSAYFVFAFFAPLREPSLSPRRQPRQGLAESMRCHFGTSSLPGGGCALPQSCSDGAH
jgi:hypothetical protein